MGGPDGWSGGSGYGPVVHLVMVWWVMPGEAAGGFLSSRAEGAVVQGEFRWEFLVPWFLGGKAHLPKRSMTTSQNSCVFLLLSLILSYCHIVILSTCHPVIFRFLFLSFQVVILSSCQIHPVKSTSYLIDQFVILLIKLPSCKQIRLLANLSSCWLLNLSILQVHCQSTSLSSCWLVTASTCNFVLLSMKSLWDMILNSRMVIAGGRAVGKSALAVRFLTRRWLDILFVFNSPLGDSSISGNGTLSELSNCPGSSANTSTAPSWFIPRGSSWKRGKLWPLRSMTPTARCRESTIPCFSILTNLERTILESLPLPSSLAFGRLLDNRYFCSQ